MKNDWVFVKMVLAHVNIVQLVIAKYSKYPALSLNDVVTGGFDRANL